MLNKLTYNPGFDLHNSDGKFEFFEGFYNQSPYCYLALEFILGSAVIHYQTLKFTTAVLKQALKDFDGVKDICREKECTELIAINADPDKKWVGFIKLFGFHDPKQVMVARRSI